MGVIFTQSKSADKGRETSVRFVLHPWIKNQLLRMTES